MLASRPSHPAAPFTPCAWSSAGVTASSPPPGVSRHLAHFRERLRPLCLHWTVRAGQWFASTTARSPDTPPTCLARRTAQVPGLPRVPLLLLAALCPPQILSLGFHCFAREWNGRDVSCPHASAANGQGLRRLRQASSPGGCREGGGGIRARGSTPPPGPTVVPTRSGRGQRQPHSSWRGGFHQWASADPCSP